MLFTNLELDPGEKVIHEARKHWFIFFGNFVFAAILLAVPPILYILSLSFLPNTAREIVSKYFFVCLFAYSIWFLIIWVSLFIKWTNYHLDAWYITGSRIINIQQKGIFHREVSSMFFGKIQDVSVEIKGVTATFMKYGDLRVQTASEDNLDFVLKDAAHPEVARRIIFEMHNKKPGMPNVV